MSTNPVFERTPHLKMVECKPDDVKEALNRVKQIQKVIMELLVRGKDYDIIPNCGEKAILLKPGAEKVINAFGLNSHFEILTKIEDYNNKYCAYTFQCTLYGGTEIITQGVGHCNTQEPKFAYKWVYKSEVPAKLDKNTLETKVTKGKHGGEYLKYRIDEEFGTKTNTVLKIAKKRAMIDAALSVGSLSEVFTQDLEDFDEDKTTQVVQELTEELINKEHQVIKEDYNCSNCNTNINENVYEFSMKWYKKPLCFNCQQKIKTNKKK